MSVDDAVVVEEPRTRPTCRALVPAERGYRKCDERAVITWYGVPFCFAHAPRRVPGRGGWGRLSG